jgi:hypothetical protein
VISSRNERRVYLWRIRPSVKPLAAYTSGAKTATLEEVICVLEAELSAGRARAHIAMGGGLLKPDDPELPDDKNQLFVAEIKRDEERHTVTLLISRTDPNAASPAFFDMRDDGRIRVENPKPPEALGWSTHLCIRTKLESGIHRACFEKQQKLSASLVMDMLDQVIKAALHKNPTYVFDSSKMQGMKKVIAPKPYRPTLDFERMPSESLMEDLKKGELSSITMAQKTSAYKGIGIPPEISSTDRKLVLHTKKHAIADMSNFVQRIMGLAKQNQYEKVTFHLDNLPGGMTNEPTIDVNVEDAMSVLYVRAQRLTEFSQILENAYENVNIEIENKMADLLITERVWL